MLPSYVFGHPASPSGPSHRPLAPPFARVFASLSAFELRGGLDVFLPRPQHRVATWDTLASGACVDIGSMIVL